MSTQERPPSSSSSSTTVENDHDMYNNSNTKSHHEHTHEHMNGNSDRPPSSSRLRSHLSSYPILSVPYRTIDAYTPFNLPSRIMASLPELPASLDVSLDSSLTQFDEAVDNKVRKPVMRAYDAVVTRPREMVRVGTKTYLDKGRQLVAGGLRYIEDGVQIVGDHLLPEDEKDGDKEDVKEKEDENDEKVKSEEGDNNATFSSYKAALLYGDASSSEDESENEDEKEGGDGDGAEDGAKKTTSKKRKKSSSDDDGPRRQLYKEALMQDADAPGADAPGGSGAEWPLAEEGQDGPAYEFDKAVAPGGSGAEWPSAPTSHLGKPQQEQPIRQNGVRALKRSKTDPSAGGGGAPRDPTEELSQLYHLLGVYANRVYLRNNGKSPSQLLKDMRGLTSSEMQLVRDWFEKEYPIERSYLAKMVEAGKKPSSSDKSQQQQQQQQESNGGGVYGLAKWGYGIGSGLVGGLFNRVRGE